MPEWVPGWLSSIVKYFYEHPGVTWSGAGFVIISAIIGVLGWIWGWFRKKPEPQPTPPININLTAPPPEPPPPPPEPATDPNALLHRYLRTMAEEWRTLRLEALDPDAAQAENPTAMSLEKVYISLNTTSPDPEAEKDQERKPLSAMAALQRASHQRMVLLGQPGAGKSTFARHLLLALARALVEDDFHLPDVLPDWKGKALLPVFVSLGKLSAALDDGGVEAALRAEVDGQVPGFGGLLLKQLESQGGMVVFDGLDEVPSGDRPQIKQAIRSFAASHPRCRVLVTCRTHSYRQDAGWHLDWEAEHELAPFDWEDIQHFVKGWYAALAGARPVLASGCEQKIDTLLRALAPTDQRDLQRLARTPLMLTVMAIVHTHRQLPNSRVEVYNECVDILLHRWQAERSGQSLREALGDLGVEGKLLSGLQEVAYDAHKSEERAQDDGGRALVSERTLRKVLPDYLGDAGLRVFLDYCQHANGLLLAAGVVRPSDAKVDQPVYAFPHLSFEEYLAALYLLELDDFEARAAELAGDPAWREVVRFLGEALCYGQKKKIRDARALLAALCPDEAPVDDGDWRRVWLAGELLPAYRSEAAGKQRDGVVDGRIVQRLVGLVENPQALGDALADRAAAGRALGWLGDPRPGVGCDPETGLPQMAWVAVPGGTFRMGQGWKDDPDAEDREAWPEDAAPVTVADFYLASFAVTVAQFQVFVESGAYGEDRYWTKNGIEDRGSRRAPYGWDDPDWTVPNHPVVGVTWFDAVAFCRWLDEQLHQAGVLGEGLVLRLPSEAEWEWAARGPDGRRWPWEDGWADGHCNSKEAGLGRTSAVGLFSAGSHCGWVGARLALPEISAYAGSLHDLAGNVWEWCSTEYRGKYPPTRVKSEWDADYLEKFERRRSPLTFRGGSWGASGVRCRGASRDRYYPDYWDSDRGVRCCVSTSSPPVR